jgi:hypothetical protein
MASNSQMMYKYAYKSRKPVLPPGVASPHQSCSIKAVSTLSFAFVNNSMSQTAHILLQKISRLPRDHPSFLDQQNIVRKMYFGFQKLS